MNQTNTSKWEFLIYLALAIHIHGNNLMTFWQYEDLSLIVMFEMPA